ncbi:MAG: hypothetical protein QXN55_07910 [Candidatus Nitrosotenuis sp.]|jgi:hypothetical protein
MSQMLIKPKQHVLYSELYFGKPQIHLKSSATELTCQLCKSGLEEGIGITAKKIGTRTVFVCGKHGF